MTFRPSFCTRCTPSLRPSHGFGGPTCKRSVNASGRRSSGYHSTSGTGCRPETTLTCTTRQTPIRLCWPRVVRTITTLIVSEIGERLFGMKICFICGEYPPGLHGGIGTMTQVLGRSLASQGHQVRVIGVYPADHQAPEFEVDRGVQVWRLRDSRNAGGWITSRVRLYRRVADWVRDGQVDLVEVPDYHGWAAGWKKLAVPVIVRLHGSLTYFAAELHQPVDQVGYFLERASLRRADYVCSVCGYTSKMTEQLFKMAFDFASVLYNPVELVPDSPGIPREKNHVVFSGTLTGKKGVVSLIKAWTTVVKSRPDAELHIFGKDARADDGRSMQASLSSLLDGARSSVFFHGHVPREKLLDVYQTSGVAVFPSRAEAFAMAPLEAMASGCPKISSG